MKSEIEKNFDEVAERYFKAFGKRYPLVITDQRSLTEHISIMENCLKNGKAQKSPRLGKEKVF